MTDAPWTPGPLDIESDAGGYRVTTMDGVTVAHVKNWEDAELFRAAPEMAELLRSMVNDYHRGYPPSFDAIENSTRILNDIMGQEVADGDES